MASTWSSSYALVCPAVAIAVLPRACCPLRVFEEEDDDEVNGRAIDRLDVVKVSSYSIYRSPTASHNFMAAV